MSLRKALWGNRKRSFFLLGICLISLPVQASVIKSSCIAEPTVERDRRVGEQGIAYPTPPPSNVLETPSRWYVEGFVNMVQSLYAWMGIQASSGEAFVHFMEDMRLYAALTLRSASDCRTEARAIFPFILRVPSRNLPEAERPTNGDPFIYRVRYKLCEYFIDGQRQLPIDDTCSILGSERGYSLPEMDARYGRLLQTVRGARYAIDGAVVLAGIWLTRGSFRLVSTSRFFASSGLLARTIVGLSPVLISAAITQTSFIDLPISALVELKDAAEVAVVGQLGRIAYVSLPMEEFAPIFAAYLNSIRR